MMFRQFFDKETWTYTYFLADFDAKEAVFIDPVDSHINDYLALLKENGLRLKYSLETHVHADHVTASGLLRQHTGAQTGVSELCGASHADQQINHGDSLTFGAEERLKVIATPGHTAGSLSFLWRDRVFTGDALFINGCGRTDFQGGDAGTLYDSVTQRLFVLPDEILVYPGHDYNGRWVSSIVQERTLNSRLADKSRDEFIELMDRLELPKPRRIDEAVPANRLCGLSEEELRQDAEMPRVSEQQASTTSDGSMTPQSLIGDAKQQITEIDTTVAAQRIKTGGITLIDVREPTEYAQGHIANAINLPRGVIEFQLDKVPALTDKDAAVVLYCGSGRRSALATAALQRLGYTHVVSLAGGYRAWQAAAQGGDVTGEDQTQCG